MQLATHDTEDQKQTFQFAADKSSPQTKKAPSASNIEGGASQTPSSSSEHLKPTSPSPINKAELEEASAAFSLMGLKENRPLSLVREYLLYSLTS